MINQSLSEALSLRGNPVFDQDTRKIGWLQRMKPKGGSDLRWLLILYGAITVGVLLVRPWELGGRGGPVLRINGLIDVNLFGSLTTLLYVIADAIYVISSIRSINSEMNSGNWDILKLTSLDQRSIIEAKYAAARLRSWPIMIVNRAVQTGLALFMMGRLISEVTNNGLSFGGIVVYWLAPLMGVIFAWYMPLWRMQAMSAASIAISARARNIAFAVLMGLGAAVLFQLGLSALGGVSNLILLELSPFPTGRFSRFHAYFSIMGFSLLAGLAVYIFTYLMAKMVASFSLRDALKVAFQAD